MIKIKFYKNGLVVSGHANYAPHGQDIVCAGVSAITMGAINWFVEEDVEIVVEEGYLSLRLLHQSQANLYLLELLQTQLSALNHEEYSQYISFQEINHELS
ncbi:ribosomal-processing cysteine protease Prp [Ureaplasma ceti]|uniref:Ribosomal processing cysteine protease Prp n=1 Tax=Ureaplasma ceti TaxID=3119530 RepID=A0ABP9U976_9BACT